MESWKKITYMVGIFIFLTQICPLQPYLTAYLTGPNGNVSLFEVANSMDSIRAYSGPVATLILLSVSDYLLYKPVLIVLTLCSSITYLLMTGSPSLIQLKVSMVGIGVSVGIFTFTYSYLLAQFEDKRLYQKVTSITVISLELGTFVSSVLSQYIVSLSGGNYSALPYYNAIAQILAFICACLLPPVKRRIFLRNTYIPNEKTRLIKNVKNNENESRRKYIVDKVIEKLHLIATISKQIWTDFTTSYSNTIVQRRSLWYVIVMAVHIQIKINMNVLFSYIVSKPGNDDVLSNGFVEAMVTLCGALGAFLIGEIRIDWTYYGDLFTAICTLLMGVLMISCYFFERLVSIYLSYILYGLVIQAVYVINKSELAKHLKSPCYSLVLGSIFLMSLVVSAVLTTFFVQMNFLDITISGRFLFIGGLDVIIGIVFMLISLFKNYE